jgi:hypothetical protein
VRDSETKSRAAKWADSAIIVCLFLFAGFAPHSIAAAQTAWLVGMLLWVARFALYPPPRVHRTPVDYALLGFFVLTGVSAFLSYEPLVSIGKLRAASLFTIVYLFAQNIPSRRVVRLLALTLVVSCMVNVLYTVTERVVGRGIKIQNVSATSPLSAAAFREHGKSRPEPIRSGDTLLAVDGKPLGDPQELATALAASDSSRALLKIYRLEWFPTLEVPRGRLLPGSTPEEQLGISAWSRGRDWRASGFYNHYVTYAEALQLILALAVGLFLSLPMKRSWMGAFLLTGIAGLGFSLLLTVTRASWLASLISSAIIVLLGASRRAILIIGALAIPLVLAGIFLLQQKRHVRFFDQSDESTTWRETVWREGFDLLVSKPRHLLVGVGMDSLKAHWREWGLFDRGRLPQGHMHSNLLQLALERGLPALIVWLLLLGVYARLLWRLARRGLPVESRPLGIRFTGAAGDSASGDWPSGDWPSGDWIDRGIALGALGGLAGFFSSGLVHYNWGDSEVVMTFYFIMGLSLFLEREARLKL